MCRKKLLAAALCIALGVTAPLCVSATEGALDEDMPPIGGTTSLAETEGTEAKAPGSEESETSEDGEESESEATGAGGETEAETPEAGEETEAKTSGTEREEETDSDDSLQKVIEVTQYALDEDLVPAPENSGSSYRSREFRFTQVDKQYAVASRKEGCSVYEGQGDAYRTVGELPYYGICYVLEDDGEDWLYIESGNVRGFVNREDIATGDVADRVVSVKGEEELPQAHLTIAKTDNAAFTYTTTTVNDVVADKEYAVADNNIEIYEQKKVSSRVTGLLPKGGLCYILEDTGEDWLYVESGDARGFVQSGALLIGKAAESSVDESGEENMATADVLVSPRDNRACYYTLTSVEEASQSWKLREEMVSFALQFVGNPYVWGGTSLTNGADCSGFVQSIYASFGYYIPRVTWDQAAYSQQIPISEALPGDLIFYYDGSTIYHVSMYIGDGMVVQAANSRAGIITSGIGGNAVYAGRIIQD